MSRLLQVWPIFIFMYWLEITNGTPLFQGFSVQKGFEVNLKPFEFKPISFFKEKWSPFGRFGVRKGIQKRDLEGMFGERTPPSPLVSPAPVFEQIDEDKLIDEKKESMDTSVTELLGPGPVKPLASNLIRIPLTESFKPPTEGFFTSIGRIQPANNYILQKPAEPVLGEVYGELPPRPVGPIPATTANFIPAQQANSIPVQPNAGIPAQPISPILTQPIGFIPPQPDGGILVQPTPKEVVPLITPPPGPTGNAAPNVPFSEIPPTDGPLVRGSKLALYFGNVFLQLVSQFLTNARLQFSQFSKQSPPPPVPISN